MIYYLLYCVAVSNKIISPALSRYHVQHVCLLLCSLVEFTVSLLFLPFHYIGFPGHSHSLSSFPISLHLISQPLKFHILWLGNGQPCSFQSFHEANWKDCRFVIRLPNLMNLSVALTNSTSSSMSPAFTVKVLKSLHLSCLPIFGHWRSYCAQTVYVRHHLFCFQPSTVFSHAASCTRKLNTPQSTTQLSCQFIWNLSSFMFSRDSQAALDLYLGTGCIPIGTPPCPWLTYTSFGLPVPLEESHHRHFCPKARQSFVYMRGSLSTLQF